MVKIVPILLCGGSGTRLWPLSRQSYPKQFTNLAKDPKYGQTLTRFQKQMAAKLKEVRTNDLGLKY